MISFPKLECWNAMTEVATIVAIQDKQRILCRIPIKILQDKFGVSKENPMQSIKLHRDAIQEAATLLIESNSYEQDGSILIRKDNL
jgi:uncharacterized protein DUF1488